MSTVFNDSSVNRNTTIELSKFVIRLDWSQCVKWCRILQIKIHYVLTTAHCTWNWYSYAALFVHEFFHCLSCSKQTCIVNRLLCLFTHL